VPGARAERRVCLRDTRCHAVFMGRAPAGFAFEVLSSGDVVIMHNARRASTLRGMAATSFLVDVQRGDPQELMARVTGNYKRGNERTASEHLRNRRR
jgi:hypothetical protein